MDIVVIGAGYVGLTTSACFAELGHTVTCIDVDAGRIADLRAGRLPIFEPGLDQLVARMTTRGRLHFSQQPSLPASRADLVMIAVGTPSGPDGAIDLRQVETAASQVAPAMRRGAILVVKSTVVPGTARRLEAMLGEAGHAVPVASNPEFLREGSAIGDFCAADRIVIGTDDEGASRCLQMLYRPLVERGVPIVATSTVSAEMIKYAANAFLALKIAYINDIADLCGAVGGDIAQVAEGIGLDARIGPGFLAPGPGFGGSCFPKDTRALAALAAAAGAPQGLIERAIELNASRKQRIVGHLLQQLPPDPAGRRVAVLGCAFKANTDDVRESAALTVVPGLAERSVAVALHDPCPPRQPPREFDAAIWCDTPYSAAEGADLIVILTEWDQYRRLDLARLAACCASKRIVDYRNLFDPQEMASAGFEYISMGRAAVAATRRAAKGGVRRAAAAAAPTN